MKTVTYFLLDDKIDPRLTFRDNRSLACVHNQHWVCYYGLLHVSGQTVSLNTPPPLDPVVYVASVDQGARVVMSYSIQNVLTWLDEDDKQKENASAKIGELEVAIKEAQATEDTIAVNEAAPQEGNEEKPIPS
jgi:hypothetical protein